MRVHPRRIQEAQWPIGRALAEAHGAPQEERAVWAVGHHADITRTDPENFGHGKDERRRLHHVDVGAAQETGLDPPLSRRPQPCTAAGARVRQLRVHHRDCSEAHHFTSGHPPGVRRSEQGEANAMAMSAGTCQGADRWACAPDEHPAGDAYRIHGEVLVHVRRDPRL